MAGSTLTHVFTRFRTLGGVESLLRRHQARDASLGFDSAILTWFEPRGIVDDRVTGAGFRWWTTIAAARRRFRTIAPGTTAGRTTIYHNCWGLSFLGVDDGSRRRIGLDHSDWPGVEHVLAAQNGLVDGMLCIGQAVEAQVRTALPKLASERIAQMPLPVAAPEKPVVHAPLEGRPMVIGVCGRVVREQKRVDRLPVLSNRLTGAGVKHRLEILGDGPDREWLARQFPKGAPVVLHGRQSGGMYTGIVDSWDAVFFASDYEGLPIALLEALSRGVVPVYPRIRSGADAYVGGIDPRLLYEAGDMTGAARLIGEMSTAREAEWMRWREASQAAARPHAGDAYDKTFAEFIQRIEGLPRISATTLPSDDALGLRAHLPFAALNRIRPDHPWRRGLV